MFVFFTDPPENVLFVVTRKDQSATMTCTAEGRPEPSYQIFRNETGQLVENGATYTIAAVNMSDVGYYKCVVENILGKKSVFLYLPLKGKILSSGDKIFNILV